ncbi:MAG: dienelactone hydrolase family protein [Polyangiaceae bacterium]|jgi:predicted dienelactone hydrolase|nr:dienelactone hydrolase family protein [Polyangiaceae bacterium]
MKFQGFKPSILALGLLACSADEPAPAATNPGASFEAPGVFPVGHERVVLQDVARGRSFGVQLWYPAAEEARGAAEQGVPVEELLEEGARKEEFRGLLAQAPERCTSRRTRSAAGAKPAEGSFPVVVFSHCSGCLRFSSFTVAERLASHGFAVVAPDHEGGTLFDARAGALAPLNGEFLGVRADDLRFTLDTLLDGASEALPAPLRGRLDGSKVGVLGHSYGAATAGKVLQEDGRFLAGFAMAAPPASIGDVQMKNIAEPLFLLVAQEDNSIKTLGNLLIEDNFNAAVGPAWLAEVKDAGHWSFSDLCAIEPSFQPGCGPGKRQSDGSDFTYLDIDQGRSIAASYATAFFSWTLRGDEQARGFIEAGAPSAVVQVRRR